MNDLDRYAQCGACKHYPAYHNDVPGARPCHAWAPDDAATNDVCPCPGWKTPKENTNAKHPDVSAQ